MTDVIEQAKNNARVFFKKVSHDHRQHYGPSSFYLETSDRKYLSTVHDVCHQRISQLYPYNIGYYNHITKSGSRKIIKPDALVFASNVIFKYAETDSQNGREEAFINYWNWLTDKEISPWKALFNGPDEIELLKNNQGDVCGYILPNHVFKQDIPWPFIMSFVMATRQPCENYRNIILIWNELVKNGVPPADAFIICPFFQKNIFKNAIELADTNYNHWPLGSCKYLAVNRFRTGNYIKNPISIHNCFCNLKDLNAPIEWDLSSKIKNIYTKECGKKVYTKYTSYMTYDINEIIKTFYEKVLPIYVGDEKDAEEKSDGS